jgi:hypothetical protein
MVRHIHKVQVWWLLVFTAPASSLCRQLRCCDDFVDRVGFGGGLPQLLLLMEVDFLWVVA